jgi:transcriptional regulator with XRE-family HTH domain
MERNSTQRTADNVRAELARRGITGADLARRLGWSNAAVSRRLQGAAPLTIEHLTAIAVEIEVPLSSLVADDPAVTGSAS